MRTFVIVEMDRAEVIKASSPEVAIKRYRKNHQSDVNASIGAVNAIKIMVDVPSQGVVITDTPNPVELPICASKVEFVSKKEADEVIKEHNLKMLGPEDSKPEHKDVN